VRITRWAGVAVAAATLAGVASLPGTATAAPATLAVQVGGDSEVNGIGFEGMRFLAPDNMTVHKGDTITFNFAGFHTATLLPDGESPDEWRAEHTAPLTGDYSLIVPDSDDGAGVFEFNPKAAFPSDPTCGTATSACAYDGKDLVNSGAPFSSNSFSVTINANAGSVVWVICLIHPDMAMRFSVVDDATTSTTQAEIDSYKTTATASDREAAAAILPHLQKPTKHKTASGKVVWDAFAGWDGDGYGLNGMFPSRLPIKKGDTVRWHFTQLMGNPHTVTFPRKQAVSLSGQFGTPMCEADPADTPPDAPPPAFCSSGPQNFELHIPAAALLPSGDHKYAGSTSGLHSSGVEGAGALTKAAYDLKFTHTSHAKGFRYACIVHGGMMTGTVVVS